MTKLQFTNELTNFEYAKTLVEKMNRRARKLAMPEITIQEISREIVKKQDGKVLMVTFEVEGEKPTVDGYQLAGSLEKHAEGNILKAAPGFDADDFPRSYRTEHYCDHCHTKRNRSKSLIFWNEDAGQFSMIGNSCAKDFFPRDLKNAVAYGGLFSTLIAEIEEPRGGMGRPVAEIREYVNAAIQIVKTYGYVKGDDKYNTGAILSAMFFSFGRLSDDMKWVREIEIEDQPETDRFFAHYASLTGDVSNFDHSLKMIIGDGVVDVTNTAMVTGACAGFLKIDAKIIERQKFEDRFPKEQTEVEEGRGVVTGWVLSKKWKSGFGYYDAPTLKVLVLDERGFKVWGTAPKAIADDLKPYDKITFTATVERSNDDCYFGFFKRPTKPEIIEKAEAI